MAGDFFNRAPKTVFFDCEMNCKLQAQRNTIAKLPNNFKICTN